jgi:hypothetical protein
VSHAHLTQIPDYSLASEVSVAKNVLEAEGFEVSTFAVPFGQYDERVLDAVRGVYRTCRIVADADAPDSLSDPGLNTLDVDPYRITARSLVRDVSVEEYLGLVDRSAGSWVVFLAHFVRDDLSWPGTITPADFETLVYRLEERGFLMLPLTEALDALEAAGGRPPR